MKKKNPQAPFSPAFFDVKLETEWLGRNFLYFEEMDSTNTYLMDGSAGKPPNGTLVLAEKQHKGRGRLDRVWYSEKAENLTFSLLFNVKEILKFSIGTINIISSLSAAVAVESLFQLKPELKWPNDVLIKRKKFCGILGEASFLGNKLERYVLGIGINVNQKNFQGDYRIPPTSLAKEIGREVERERFLAEYLNLYEEFIRTALHNPSALVMQWRQRCRLIGERITVDQNGKLLQGVFEDIDDDGNLLLLSRNKIQKIIFGDVSIE